LTPLKAEVEKVVCRKVEKVVGLGVVWAGWAEGRHNAKKPIPKGTGFFG
jgi:hypothetical protein